MSGAPEIPDAEFLFAEAVRNINCNVGNTEVEVLNRAAGNAYKNDDVKMALNLYSKLILRQPSMHAYYMRALCHIRLENYEEAKTDCKHYIQNYGNDATPIWEALTIAFKKLGLETEYYAAKARYDQCMERDCQNFQRR